MLLEPGGLGVRPDAIDAYGAPGQRGVHNAMPEALGSPESKHGGVN